MKGIRHEKEYIAKPVADFYFNQLLQLDWTIVLWGKNKKPLPRLVFQPSLEEINSIDCLCELVQLIQTKESVKIVGIFLNYYRDGMDYLPYHTDKYDCDVISLSFGCTRDIFFKENTTKKRTKFVLENGDFLFFKEEINNDFKHGIPKRTKVTNSRINITMFVKSK